MRGSIQTGLHRTYEAVLLVLVAVLAVTVVVQTRRIDLITNPPLPELHVGQQLPALTGQAPGGASAIVSYAPGAAPVVLYLFRPDCPWCERNLDNLQALLGNERQRYRLVGVSLDKTGVRAYLRRHELHFDRVIVSVTPKEISAYDLVVTPTTLVISGQGRVLQAWYGAYSPALQRAIENYFRIRLPGIRTAP